MVLAPSRSFKHCWLLRLPSMLNTELIDFFATETIFNKVCANHFHFGQSLIKRVRMLGSEFFLLHHSFRHWTLKDFLHLLIRSTCILKSRICYLLRRIRNFIKKHRIIQYVIAPFIWHPSLNLIIWHTLFSMDSPRAFRIENVGRF